MFLLVNLSPKHSKHSKDQKMMRPFRNLMEFGESPGDGPILFNGDRIPCCKRLICAFGMHPTGAVTDADNHLHRRPRPDDNKTYKKQNHGSTLARQHEAQWKAGSQDSVQTWSKEKKTRRKCPVKSSQKSLSILFFDGCHSFPLASLLPGCRPRTRRREWGMALLHPGSNKKHLRIAFEVSSVYNATQFHGTVLVGIQTLTIRYNSKVKMVRICQKNIEKTECSWTQAEEAG